MKADLVQLAQPGRFPAAGLLPALLFGMLLLAILSGCGRKGPVQPLSGMAPAAPENLQILQQGNSLLLSWRVPQGDTAKDLRGYRIDRLEYAAADGCPSCREPRETVIRFSLRNLGPVQQINRRLYWRDTRIVPGSGYFYRVVAEGYGGRQGGAATTYRARLAPPDPPARLQADIEGDRLLLSWKPPDALPEGASPVGYNLYRRSLNGLFLPVPLNAEVLEDPEVVDRGLASGRTYAYRVSLLVRIGEALVESPPSQILQFTVPGGE
ncbi:MAG TPA: fibronectin type III domain-containing protein [Desulfuromonadales bacterium]|nr:fibronectin type III domain-containing protein [Desulfuromonadales bacterium]